MPSGVHEELARVGGTDVLFAPGSIPLVPLHSPKGKTKAVVTALRRDGLNHARCST